MKIRLNYSVFLFALIALIESDAKEGSDTWSAYHGQKKWISANSICVGLGLRLPTIDELKAASRTGETYSWKEAGLFYWSSTPDGKLYYVLGKSIGNVSSANPSGSNDFRCIK